MSTPEQREPTSWAAFIKEAVQEYVRSLHIPKMTEFFEINRRQAVDLERRLARLERMAEKLGKALLQESV